MINRKSLLFKYLVTDYFTAFLAWITFYSVRKILLGETGETISLKILGQAALVSFFWILLYTLLNFYRNIFRQSRVKEIIYLGQVSLLGGMILFFGLLLDDQGVQNYFSYYKTLAAYFSIHFLFSAIGKFSILTYFKSLIARRVITFNTLLVGSLDKARTVQGELEQNSKLLGLNILGFVGNTPSATGEEQDLNQLGTYHQLPGLIVQNNVEEVILTLEPSEHRQIEEILSILEGQGVRVSILPDLYQILLGSVRVNHLFGTPLIEIKQDLLPVWQEVSKRAIDILVSLLVLVLFFPFFLIIGLLVRWSSPGPVIYGQERIGKGGVPFKIYKFRSMVRDAENNGPALSFIDDPRITPWGRVMRKIHLDELPQFYNVLIGNMSLVGPRPERQFFIDQIVLRAPHYQHLLRVRPGITSLGLVKFGYAENVDEMIRRLSYDILYIENMSLAMDFRVLLYTIKVIIEGRGK